MASVLREVRRLNKHYKTADLSFLHSLIKLFWNANLSKKKKRSIKIGKNTYVFPPQLKSGSREQENEKIDKRQKKKKS